MSQLNVNFIIRKQQFWWGISNFSGINIIADGFADTETEAYTQALAFIAKKEKEEHEGNIHSSGRSP